ncbi:hypothetical protein ACQZV8_04040 [Magnetococcales bacterium HHB-1]
MAKQTSDHAWLQKTSKVFNLLLQEYSGLGLRNALVFTLVASKPGISTAELTQILDEPTSLIIKSGTQLEQTFQLVTPCDPTLPSRQLCYKPTPKGEKLSRKMVEQYH